ncbi:hypothetical protein [uncultured Eudoraea sp.]|uniref:hypothetical protein n=1 Tax=uncultured Eudoraea sp. TaxID=1035614 RepID=UPI0026214624|nr:hypothetical protein [uncultured Eudoraea sp.]
MKKIFLLLCAIVTMLFGCSSDDGGNAPVLIDDEPQQMDDQVDDPPPPVENTVKLADNTTFGSIITDSAGLSLYFFSLDTKDTSECLSVCLDTWPVFYEADIMVDTGLNASDFATIDRSDGTKQTTYKGWPLYYFANDSAAGDTNGDGVNNVWYVSKPDLSLMYVTAQLVGHDDKNYLSDYTEGEGATFYIVDIDGRTLYIFINDTNNTNNYTQSDFSNNAVWPIAEIALDKLPSILDNDDFGSIDVFGRTQLTYKGWPLYYFGQDVVRGDNKGISFPAPGVWPIANIDLAVAP